MHGQRFVIPVSPLHAASLPQGAVDSGILTNSAIKPLVNRAIADWKAAGTDVAAVEIPADINASTTYPIATLTESENKKTAHAFVDYVLSPAGTSALQEAGFSVS